MNRDPIPRAFVWHVGFQLAEALLFLFFGITDFKDGKAVPHWPLICNRDVHSGNVFLQPRSKGICNDGLGNFPDIVLADFGEAKNFSPADVTYQRDQLEQLRDVQSIADIMDDMASWTGKGRTLEPLQDPLFEDHVLSSWIEKMHDACLGSPASGRIQAMLRLLLNFANIADLERRAHFQPLSAAAEAVLSLNEASEEIILRGILQDRRLRQIEETTRKTKIVASVSTAFVA